MLYIEDTIFLLNTRRETADKICHADHKGSRDTKIYHPELFVDVIISYLYTYDLYGPYIMFLMRADPLGG